MFIPKNIDEVFSVLPNFSHEYFVFVITCVDLIFFDHSGGQRNIEFVTLNCYGEFHDVAYFLCYVFSNIPFFL